MLNLALLDGGPSWILKGASLDMDFANGRAWAGGGKAFTDLLSCTRAQTAGSYALNSAGGFVLFSADTLRITDRGLLVEQAATNLLLRSRNFSNAAWVKVNVTATVDQTGPDGIVNSASSLLATSANGTALQTVTLASSQRTLSFWVKRLTGSGAINISQDGIVWTAITGLINSNTYTQVTLTATQLNPVCGFQIATSGDSVAVDLSGLEAGAFATSPIPTTSATVLRNADVITLTGAALTAALNAKAAYFQTNSVMGTPSSNRVLEFSGGSLIFLPSTTQLRIQDAVPNSATLTIGASGTMATLVKSAFGFDNSSMTGIANGGAKATQTTSSFTTTQAGTVTIGDRGAGDRALNGYMLRAAFGPTKGGFDGLTA